MIKSLGKWNQILKQEFNKPYMKFIEQQLEKNINLCPSKENIFKAYELTQPDDVKVVILGQAPSPIAGVSHGLAFSTLDSKLPATLRVILDELVNCGISSKRRRNYDLTDWAKQGVLLLNCTLTTETDKVLAHGTWGWDLFVSSTLEYLKNSSQPIVYLVWGEQATNIYDSVKAGVNNEVLYGCYPLVPLYNGNLKFVGNNHFLKANKFLSDNNLSPIEWHGE